MLISQPEATIGCLAICRTTLKMIRSPLRKLITFDAVRKLLKKKAYSEMNKPNNRQTAVIVRRHYFAHPMCHIMCKILSVF